MSFQNDLQSPSFHFWKTFSKRGTQSRNKIKVHNWDYKSSYTIKTQDIQKQQKIWIICENIKSFQYACFRLLQTLKIIHNEKHFSLPHKKSTNILNYHTKGSQPYNFAPPNKKSTHTHTYNFFLPHKSSTHTLWTSKQEFTHPTFSNYVQTWSSVMEVRRQPSLRLGLTPTKHFLHFELRSDLILSDRGT